jgi:hypothetical protein
VRLYGLEASFGRLLRLYEHLAAGGRAREFDQAGRPRGPCRELVNLWAGPWH